MFSIILKVIFHRLKYEHLKLKNLTLFQKMKIENNKIREWQLIKLFLSILKYF